MNNGLKNKMNEEYLGLDIRYKELYGFRKRIKNNKPCPNKSRTEYAQSHSPSSFCWLS